jgi:hypothetical protein
MDLMKTRKRIAARRMVGTVIAEAMERRMMLSGTPPAVLANGVLTVTGTSGADTISVVVGGEVSVVTTLNGVSQTFAAAQVGTVIINGGSGDQPRQWQ